MNETSALVISGLTHYRFRERGTDTVHDVPIDQLSTKQWRRFAQQISASRADLFRKSYQRFMREVAALGGAEAGDATQVAEKTLQMRRLKATLRVVREAAYARIVRSWAKKDPSCDLQAATRVIRQRAGDAAIKRLAVIRAEQKEILNDPSFIATVDALREQVTWCDMRELRQIERTFRKRIGNVFAFIEITTEQVSVIRTEVNSSQHQLQLNQRSTSPQLDDFDVVAFLEDDEEDVMGRMLAESAKVAPRFEVQSEEKLRSERREQLLQKLEGQDTPGNSRGAAEEQLAKMNMFRKPS